MTKVVVVVGTRPEAIKTAPVIIRLQRERAFVTRVCATGQHREMLRDTLGDFGIEPDIDLNVMQPGQTLAGLTSKLFVAIDAMLEQERPDWLLVQGDTTSAMVGSLCSFYRRTRVAHIEAGLRSFDRSAPFPEEVNRRICSMIADVHFAPTPISKQNLIAEGIPPNDVIVTGNTVIDALLLMGERVLGNPPALPPEIARLLKTYERTILITGHRRESFGEGFRNVCNAIRRLASERPEILFLYPVHLNPQVQAPVREILADVPNICLSPPFSYREFVFLLDACHIVLTDSGGIQEEAPSFGKPVLVMREVTERPEGIEAGVAKLVGAHEDAIVQSVSQLLNDPVAYASFTGKPNPYGDGKAAERIVGALCAQYSLESLAS